MTLRVPVYSARMARKPLSAAFTLTELLIAMGIGGIILAAVVLTSITFARGFAGMFNYTDMNMTSRYAMDQISRDVRGATAVLPSPTNSLQLATINPAVTITYTYDPAAGTLQRTKTGQSATTLLTHCDSWAAALYQKTPQTNFQNYVATTIGTAKLISMNWRCSRTVLGLKLNTETVQEAKIVIRN
jgi:prepilin-type N-terminal cleavage/methylation domain-containing protein